MNDPERALGNAAQFFGGHGPQSCHQCGKVWSLEQVVSGVRDRSIVAQRFTGRVFCKPCWNDYRRQEGLP